MDKLELLDDVMVDKPKVNLTLILSWWEKKRLIYTLFVLSTQVLLINLYSEGLDRYGVPNAIFQSILYLIAANLFYCMGWGFEILLKYYSKGIRLNNKTKMTLFILGTVFSITLTWFLYKWSLDYVMINL